METFKFILKKIGLGVFLEQGFRELNILGKFIFTIMWIGGVWFMSFLAWWFWDFTGLFPETWIVVGEFLFYIPHQINCIIGFFPNWKGC
jgi:hypothetical protein